MYRKLPLVFLCVGLILGCDSPEDRALVYLSKADAFYEAGNYDEADLE